MNATSAAAAQPSATAEPNRTQLARNKLSETYDNFLKLLTTQLQHQDPLAPMDSAQFTNQLVLYSQVEQQISQNEKLERLLKVQTTNNTHAALGFIGLDVDIEGRDVPYTGQPVKIAYTLPEQAGMAKLRILDAKGEVVQVVDAQTKAGTHEFVWDGRTRQGSLAAPGAYAVEVLAVDGAEQRLTVGTTVSGRVSGIETDKGETVLLVGSVPVRMEQIRSARAPNATSANNS